MNKFIQRLTTLLIEDAPEDNSKAINKNYVRLYRRKHLVGKPYRTDQLLAVDLSLDYLLPINSIREDVYEYADGSTEILSHISFGQNGGIGWIVESPDEIWDLVAKASRDHSHIELRYSPRDNIKAGD